MERPETRYSWNVDVALAYQVFGDGPVDLVYMQGFTSHVDFNRESRSPTDTDVLRLAQHGTGTLRMGSRAQSLILLFEDVGEQSATVDVATLRGTGARRKGVEER